MSNTRTIKVGYLARVEGEGGLHVKIKGDRVTNVRMNIFEPPRFFEAFLQGRDYSEAPDITARICGICPVAYQMSSVHAMERAFGVDVGQQEPQIRALRRLLYCGEWIESHALHVFMLHAPDFLGYNDAIAMSKDHPDLVQNALRLKKIGNEVMTLLGGREIHPINVRVGGFYRVPSKRELETLVERLQWAREMSLETVNLVATFPFPEFERDYEFVALQHPSEYPLNEGRLVSNKGLDISIAEYEEHFFEEHVAYSNALHSVHKGHGSYFVGPMARYSLNFDKLSPLAQDAAMAAGLDSTCRNPFKSIIVRAVELVYACDEALRIIGQYTPPARAFVPMPVADDRSQQSETVLRGYGCTEAPRGILYHRYTLTSDGNILDARIVPPTSQNQKTIEEDLRDFVTERVEMPLEELTWQCEQAVRNYDPCISCATHFLRLSIERDV